MKKTLLAAALFASLLPATAFAQGGGGPVVGVDLQAAFPVGDFGDGAGLGFGGLLRYEFTIANAANITGRGGFMYHLEKNTFTFFTFPLLVGTKIKLGQSAYVGVETGAFINHTDPGGFDAALGFTLGVGYRISSLDFRIGAEMVDAGHALDSIALIGGLGYNF
jgi:opacity protein-like surface antigen